MPEFFMDPATKVSFIDDNQDGVPDSLSLDIDFSYFIKRPQFYRNFGIANVIINVNWFNSSSSSYESLPRIEDFMFVNGLGTSKTQVTFLIPYEGNYLVDITIRMQTEAGVLSGYRDFQLTNLLKYPSVNEISYIYRNSPPNLYDFDFNGVPDSVKTYNSYILNPQNSENVEILSELSYLNPNSGNWDKVKSHLDKYYLQNFEAQGSLFYYTANTTGEYSLTQTITTDGTIIEVLSSDPFTLDALKPIPDSNNVQENFIFISMQTETTLDWDGDSLKDLMVVNIASSFYTKTSNNIIYRAIIYRIENSGPVVESAKFDIRFVQGFGYKKFAFAVAWLPLYSADYVINITLGFQGPNYYFLDKLSIEFPNMDKYDFSTIGRLTLVGTEDVDKRNQNNLIVMDSNIPFNFNSETVLTIQHDIFVADLEGRWVLIDTIVINRTVDGYDELLIAFKYPVPFDGRYKIQLSIANEDVTLISKDIIFSDVRMTIDDLAPKVNSPPDITYPVGEVGEIDNIIPWIIFDKYLKNITILLDGKPVVELSMRALNFPLTLVTAINPFWGEIPLSMDSSGLEIGLYNYTIVVRDAFDNIATDTVWVEVISVNKAPPELMYSYADISFLKGIVDNYAVWRFEDNNPYNYSISVDGVLVLQDQTWSNDANIEFNLDNLAVGVHEVTVTVEDLDGNQISHTVIITVLQNQPPQVATRPADISYLVGSTGNYLQWEVSDENPVSYNITIDGILTLENSWFFQSISPSINIDGLSVGVHTLVISFYDRFGLFTIDTVMITVTSRPTEMSATASIPTIADPVGWSISEVIVLLALGLIPIPLQRRRKNEMN